MQPKMMQTAIGSSKPVLPTPMNAWLRFKQLFCVEHSDFPILTASETCDPFVSVQKLGEVFGGTHSNWSNSIWASCLLT